MADLNHDVSVNLTYDEAMVLSDWIYRVESSESALVALAADRAELIALSALSSALEPLIDEVFSAEYGEDLAAAKRRLSGES